MNPTLLTGLGIWDADKLPADEFEARIEGVREGMRATGLDAAIVHGSVLDHAALAYVSGYVPWKSWGLAVIPLEGAPWLLVPGSERDLFGMRTQSWMPDMRSHLDWSGAVDPWLAGRTGQSTAIGLAGADAAMPWVLARLEEAIAGRAALVETPGLIARYGLRARERVAVQEAIDIVGAAVREARHAACQGISAFHALIRAERAARLAGAQDVRVMVGVDGGRLFVPLGSCEPQGASRLAGYLAVQHMGYWADAFVADEAGADIRYAEALLARLLDELRPGAPANALFERIRAGAEDRTLHPALEGALGRRIGLSLDEGAAIHPANGDAIEQGSVYSLAVGFEGSGIAGAMALVTARGARRLAPREIAPFDGGLAA